MLHDIRLPDRIWLTSGGAFVVATIGYWSPTALLSIVFAAYSLVLIALTIAVTVYVQHLWNAPRPAKPTHYPPDLLLNVIRLRRFDPPQPPALLPIVFGRTVDGLLLQLLDLTIRDFVMSWLGEVTRASRLHADIWRADVWLAVQRLKERALRVDVARMVAVDMTVRVTVHLEKIRIARARAHEHHTSAPPNISTSSYLANDTTELEFLRRLCEVAAIHLLPRGYSLDPLRLLLTEMLALKCVLPLVQLITSPDFLNQRIVHHIQTSLAAAALRKRCYEYAASYEDFLRIIAASQSVDELLLMRNSCVNDMMQATTQQMLQQQRYQHQHGGHSPLNPSDNGGDSTAAAAATAAATGPDANHSRQHQQQQMRLRRYIAQLALAKSHCEKQLARLGWSGGFANDPSMPLPDILSTVAGRRQFVLFLEPLQASGMIGFYTAVEELRQAQRSAYHQLGSEIYYAYIRAPAAAAVRVEHSVRQRMESFLLGDQGPEVFYEAQRTVLEQLEEKYCAPFVLSPEYAELKRLLSAEADAATAAVGVMNGCGGLNGGGGSCVGESPPLSAKSSEAKMELTYVPISPPITPPPPPPQQQQAPADVDALRTRCDSTYARTKLDQLQERLDNKTHALAALRASLRPESKLLAVLGREVDWLSMEKRQLEAHLRRTELWAEHLGDWRASVQSVEVPDEKEPPQFMILVQVDERRQQQQTMEATELTEEAARMGDVGCGGISTGWVVLRSLAEFHELHKKLRPLCAHLKSPPELPSTAFKLFFPKNDRTSLEKAKVQRYLNFILEEDRLYPSEAIYAFLSPSSENLKQQASVSPKRNKFSLLTLFKNNGDVNVQQQQQQQQQQQRDNDPFWGPCGPREGEEDISILLEGGNTLSDTSSNSTATDTGAGPSSATAATSVTTAASNQNPGDSIAEPLYALMGEIFDMGGGVFKWLRRSLISFVQITYGRTINRQIRESVLTAFDETRLHFYATTALQTFWPGGQLAGPASPRSDDTQQMTATAAQSLLLDNIPEVMSNLVGAQTARSGTLKVWEALQQQAWNKQLFYELLEIVMVELFPEVRQLKEPFGRTPPNSAKW